MTVSPVIAEMEWEASLLPPTLVAADVERDIRRQLGGVPSWLTRIGRVPWLARALAMMMSKPVAHLDPNLCELVLLVVSQDNSCRYCFGVQRTMLRILGFREAYIARLERDIHLAELSSAEQTALQFARRVSRADPRPSAADYGALTRAGFSRAAAAELAFVAAATVFANRVATLLALPPDPVEIMAERPIFRLLRPLIARRVRTRPRRPEPLPRPNDGPWAAVVATLDGSPAAGVLRRVIDQGWASDVLPTRTKLLILAVVARALGCVTSEAEARARLEREDLGAGDVDVILATLASPRLDAREAQLVPFARETAHHQDPVRLQRRMREVTRGLEPAEILEAVGTMALANSICRLSVLLDIC